MINRDERRKRLETGGWTITELMVILGLIAVISAIAYPNLQRYVINERLRTAARDVMADFASLKGRAAAEGAQYRIVLNTGGNAYALQQCGLGPGCVDPGPCTVQGNPGGCWMPVQSKVLAAFGNGIVFDSPSVTTYTFQTRGTVTAGTIGLKNSRGSTAAVTINITGRVSVAFTPK